MEFETILRAREYKQEIENEERELTWIISGEINSMELQDTRLSSIQNAYSIWIEKKKGNLSKQKRYKLYDEFDEEVSAEALEKLKKQIELSKQEKEYIQYQIVSGYYRQERKKSINRSFSKKSFARKITRRKHFRNFESFARRSGYE